MKWDAWCDLEDLLWGAETLLIDEDWSGQLAELDNVEVW